MPRGSESWHSCPLAINNKNIKTLIPAVLSRVPTAPLSLSLAPFLALAPTARATGGAAVTKISVLAAGFLMISPALAETANSLLQACEVLEREMRLRGDELWVQSTDAHRCWGYIGAVQD